MWTNLISMQAIDLIGICKNKFVTVLVKRTTSFNNELAP